MSLFDEYLKNRDTSKADLTEKVKARTGNADPRYWKPKFNEESGTGFAVIRFLPGKDLAELPYVKIFNHYFKGSNGSVYFEKSLSTIGQDDPVGQLNSRMWNHGDDKYKEAARDQKRKVQYTANIQVITDPDRPDAEGKVFLYRFGQKIFDKIQLALEPEFDDETSINPFDLMEGANFKIKMRKKDDWLNYDSSEFDTANIGPISEDQKEMEEIFNSQHDLSEFTDPGEYKSYSDLSDLLYSVIGSDFPEFFDTAAAEPAQMSASNLMQKAAEASPAAAAETTATESAEGNTDIDEFFKALSDEG